MKKWLKDAWAIFITPYQIIFETISEFTDTVANYEKALIQIRCLDLHNKNLHLGFIIKNCYPIYQEHFRFYLDDYKEQEELREEWFKKFPRYGKSPALEFFQNRFMRKN